MTIAHVIITVSRAMVVPHSIVVWATMKAVTFSIALPMVYFVKSLSVSLTKVLSLTVIVSVTPHNLTSTVSPSLAPPARFSYLSPLPLWCHRRDRKSSFKPRHNWFETFTRPVRLKGTGHYWPQTAGSMTKRGRLRAGQNVLANLR